jgi:uncharacterized membrane protein
MDRIRKAVNQPFNWIIFFLLILNALPILAPLFAHWGWEWAAKPIYFIYSFTCHQFAHRSLHVHDHQCAWCSRDMAIWGSVLLVAIIVRQQKLRRSIAWYWMVPFTIPIALDGGIQTIATVLGVNAVSGAGDAFYISTNLMRVITGSIFGTGLGLWMLPALYDSFLPQVEQLKAMTQSRPWKQAFLSIATIFVLFLGFVQLWSITSPTVKPANFIDLQVKSPVSKEFFVRRENGSCPVNAVGGDPLALECFFPQKS